MTIIRYVQVVTTQEDLDAIKESAFHEKLTLSEWMLNAARFYIDKQKGLTKEEKEAKLNCS
jgi:hypothetical protein